MPRIRLRVIEETSVTPYRFRDPSAGVVTIPMLRLASLARVDPRPGHPRPSSLPLTAAIDTGAWISAIETQAWRDYEAAGLLERLPFDGPPTRAAAVGGVATQYQLGRIWVALLDPQPPRRPPGTPVALELPAVPVVAQLLLNPLCRLPYALVLGLHLGVLDGRRLTREVATPRPCPLATDRGAQFAQEWHLETP